MNFISANTNNFEKGRKGKNINLIVIHSIVGSAASAIHTFQANTKKSAHYIVGWNGEITQMVHDEDTAYHAANYEVNLTSIGIEHDDQAQPNIVRPDVLYEASAGLVAALCKKYGIPCDRTHIKKHSEVRVTNCPGGLDIDRIVARANQLLDTMPEHQPIIYGVINTGKVVNVRNTPRLDDNNIIGTLNPGEKFIIEGQVPGDSVLSNNLWYKVKDHVAYIWSGRVSTETAQGAPPVQDDRVLVPSIWARAAKVLADALPSLRTKDNQLFGNEEGLARELVSEWPSYLQLIVAEKKQKSLLEKIMSILGLGKGV